MTKEQIRKEALVYGWAASFSGSNQTWYLKRIRSSMNTHAFDRKVFINLTRKLGIEGKVKEVR